MYLHACKVDEGQDDNDDGGDYSNHRGYANDGKADHFSRLTVHQPRATLWLAKTTSRRLRKEFEIFPARQFCTIIHIL